MVTGSSRMPEGLWQLLRLKWKSKNVSIGWINEDNWSEKYERRHRMFRSRAAYLWANFSSFFFSLRMGCTTALEMAWNCSISQSSLGYVSFGIEWNEITFLHKKIYWSEQQGAPIIKKVRCIWDYLVNVTPKNVLMWGSCTGLSVAFIILILPGWFCIHLDKIRHVI